MKKYLAQLIAFLVLIFPALPIAAEVESYGPLFHSNANEGISVFSYAGQVHWMGYFDRADSAGLPGSAFYVNLTTGESSSYPSICPGRYNGYSKSAIGSKLYTASLDPGYFCEFDLISKTWTNRGLYGVAPSDKGAQTRVGPDNRLYIGGAVRGSLDRWDPIRLAFDRYGVIDPPVWKFGMNNTSIKLVSVIVRGAIATVTTGTSHKMTVDTKVKVSGASIAALNGTFPVATVPTSDSFTISVTGVPDGTYHDTTLALRNIECVGCLRYVYSFVISPDARFIYLALRDAAVDRWWLVIRSTDPTVTSEKVCWEDNNFSQAYARYGLDGKIYVQNYNGTLGSSTYELTDGNCPTVALSTTPAYRDQEFQPDTINSFSTDLVKNAFNYEVNYDDLYADTSNAGMPKLRYRAVGANTWNERTGSITTWPVVIKRLGVLDAQRLLLMAGAYGPNAAFNLSTKQTSVLGRIGSQSVYDSATISPYVLFSGYPTVSYRADTRIPWTWSASNNTTCTASNHSNPCIAAQSWGKYHSNSAIGKDGLFYVASNYARQDGLGGEIGWYNPTNNALGSYRNGPPSIRCFSAEDFISVSSSVPGEGQRFAYSGNANSGGADSCIELQGRIFIFDATSKSIVANYPTIQGAVSPGKLVDVGDGTILGFIREFPAVGKYTVYRIQSSTGALLWSKEYSGILYSSSGDVEFQLAQGPDGAIYYPIGRKIQKLTASDGVTVTVGEPLATVDPEITRLKFVGRDLWFVSGSKLKVYRNLVSGVVPQPMAPTNVRVTR